LGDEMVNGTMGAIQLDLSPLHPSHLIRWSMHGPECVTCGAITEAQLRATCPVGKEVLDSGEDSYCRDDGDHYDGHGVHLTR
jgi:hypothetical protein